MDGAPAPAWPAAGLALLLAVPGPASCGPSGDHGEQVRRHLACAERLAPLARTGLGLVEPGLAAVPARRGLRRGFYLVSEEGAAFTSVPWNPTSRDWSYPYSLRTRAGPRVLRYGDLHLGTRLSLSSPGSWDGELPPAETGYALDEAPAAMAALRGEFLVGLERLPGEFRQFNGFLSRPEERIELELAYGRALDACQAVPDPKVRESASAAASALFGR